MVFFITFLRALAACLITNAHYTGVYPTDLIANGGLIGDVLFFAISGYCLCNVKGTFVRWYGKRIWRVYLPVVVVTSIYFMTGCYDFSVYGFLWWFLYPTYYHFVASIIVLYIPFYFCMKNGVLKQNLFLIMGFVGIAWLIVYYMIYDRSYYHIDMVREPMIRFLFFESMMIGACIRKYDSKIRNRLRKWCVPVTVVLLPIYFVSKYAFSHHKNIVQFQILNQLLILILVVFLFVCFGGIDSKLEKMPKWMKKIVSFVSSITLEIYLVQNVLIELIRPRMTFPINWVVLTGTILIAAFLLHQICRIIYIMVDKVFIRLSKKEI